MSSTPSSPPPPNDSGPTAAPRNDPEFVDLLRGLEDLCVEAWLRGVSSDEQYIRCKAALTATEELPPFDEEGVLPPATHLCNLSEINHRFGGTGRRRRLLVIVNDLVRLGRQAGAYRLLLGGSFLTRKPAPGDVDAAFLMPPDFLRHVASGDKAANQLFDLSLRIDPELHLFIDDSEPVWFGKCSWFSRSTDPRLPPKGIVEVRL